MMRCDELIVIGMTRCLGLHLPLWARVRYRGLRRVGGIWIGELSLRVVFYPTLVVLGLGLGVLFCIVKSGSSADHVRWCLGSVGSRAGMI